MHIQDEGAGGTCRGGIRLSTTRAVQVDGCAHDVVPRAFFLFYFSREMRFLAFVMRRVRWSLLRLFHDVAWVKRRSSSSVHGANVPRSLPRDDVGGGGGATRARAWTDPSHRKREEGEGTWHAMVRARTHANRKGGAREGGREEPDDCQVIFET